MQASRHWELRGRWNQPWGLSGVTLLCLVLLAAWRLGAADRKVVINEIMYHPPNDREELQYVELFNGGEAPVDLSGWKFTRGIQYEFPPGTTLGAGGFVVVCRDRLGFARHYGQGLAVLGDFSGRLSHGGETIELSDAAGQLVERMRYSDDRPWPAGPDGYSASLERICPYAPAEGPEQWAGSPLPEWEGAAGSPGERNASYAAQVPPRIAKVEYRPGATGQPVSVTAEVTDPDGIGAVALLYRVIQPRQQEAEVEIPMRMVGGSGGEGRYQAVIPGQPPGRLVRFRIQARDGAGGVRYEPGVNEPRWTYSYSTFENTNEARVAFGHLLLTGQWPAVQPRPGRQAGADPVRGNGAFIYVPAGESNVVTYDHVVIRRRKGGFKVHFLKDERFKEMSGINLIFEGPPRYVLAEALAYELYRRAGVPAPLTEHVRLWLDGRLLGYQLLVEQPNKAFLARNERNTEGHLYKLVWQGHGVIGQHEKKTRAGSGHQDLVETVEVLNRKRGAEQWEYIQSQFNVEEFVNYYAVNMCIQNWDGFWNNYFAYHDTEGTGKWEVYPWDEDKTWGDYDGASPAYDWYDMPLTFGMNGSHPAQQNLFLGSRRGRGPHGGASWWRQPGHFSGPLLANPEFRRRFLARLEELCRGVFAEEQFYPVIDRMEEQLEPEIAVRSEVVRDGATEAMRRFRRHMESFRDQVKHRRAFILRELARDSGHGPFWARWSWQMWVVIVVAALGVGLVSVLLGLAFILRISRRKVGRRGARPPPLPR